MRKLSIVFLASLFWASVFNSAANDPILSELIAKNKQVTQAAQCLDVSKQALLSQWTESYHQAIQSQPCPVAGSDSDSFPLPGTVAEDEDLRQAAKLVKGQLNLEHCLNAGQRLQYYDWRKEQTNLPASDRDCTQAKKPSPLVIPQPPTTPKPMVPVKTTTAPPLPMRKPAAPCENEFTVVEKTTLGNIDQGLSSKDAEWVRKLTSKKFHSICYADPSPAVPLVFFIEATPAVYHGTKEVPHTETSNTDISGNVRGRVSGDVDATVSGNVNATATTTTQKSTTVPYDVDYAVFTLTVQTRNVTGEFMARRRFQQRGLYRVLYGFIPLGGKGHHPVHAVIEEAMEWVHKGGLTNSLQTISLPAK